MSFRVFSRFLMILVLLGSVSIISAEDDETKAKLKKFNNITGTDAINAQFRSLLKEKAETKKLLVVAVAMAKEKEQPFNYNASLLLGRTAFALKQYDQAETFYNLCSDLATKLQSANKLAEIFENKIDLYSATKRFGEAEKACKAFLEIEAEDEDSPINKAKPLIFAQMAQVMAKRGKVKEAVKLVDSILENEEGNWFFMRVKGFVLREGERYDEAVEAFSETIERLKKNKTMPEDLKKDFVNSTRYILSAVYIDLKKIDKSVATLEELLKDDPENATYNNDLGFVLADNDLRLDEAEKLVKKALEIDRAKRKKLELPPDLDVDNAAYLDSLAWVQFKKKNYAEAKKNMLLAVKDEEEGQHVEIQDHLADVHIALGETKEAIAVWEKALKLESNGKRDKERKAIIEKKLKAVQEKK